VLVVTHVKLQKQTTALLNEFKELAKQLPEVQICLHVSSRWNFILHITAPTPQAYFQFIMERITGLENVAHLESHFVMKECKSNGAFSLTTPG
jgi:Lrp/AsnC family leucine-responsive transcriptional regulator